jgi:hypothetical protein
MESISLVFGSRPFDNGSKQAKTSAIPPGVAADGVPEPAGGIFSAGVANPAAGVLSKGIVGLAAVAFVVSFSLGGVPPAGGAAGVSTLPRMIGKPSLPLPMTTTFEFVDCES